MSFENFSDYWNLIFVAPLAYLMQRFVSHSSRISTLKANQKNNLNKLDKIDDLCTDISYIKGLLDEHLKK
ncbi:MAG: hypothetical protein GKS07_10920 [Nitrosopumilus sp.]|nr:MAG: hypothetical protein GKS07_00485 [Nitrosopumilus sp.]QMU55353.1 MAG: hypothetical protein GKS07_10920 [Nitrosopumilus sp.]